MLNWFLQPVFDEFSLIDNDQDLQETKLASGVSKACYILRVQLQKSQAKSFL